jgi:hypothetical protein
LAALQFHHLERRLAHPNPCDQALSETRALKAVPAAQCWRAVQSELLWKAFQELQQPLRAELAAGI